MPQFQPYAKKHLPPESIESNTLKGHRFSGTSRSLTKGCCHPASGRVDSLVTPCESCTTTVGPKYEEQALKGDGNQLWARSNGTWHTEDANTL